MEVITENVPVDKDIDIINKMSATTGVKYSDEQVNILKHHGGMCILACAGSGKALKNGTGVLTPTGYKGIDKLKIGDKCFDEHGNEQTVIGVYPQGEKRQIYRVRFSDNSTIDCDENHLWTYKINDAYKTDCTRDIFNVINNINDSLDICGSFIKLQLPPVEPVKFKHSGVLAINPYVAGIMFSKHFKYCSCSKYSFVNLPKRVREKLIANLDSMGLIITEDWYTNNLNNSITVESDELSDYMVKTEISRSRCKGKERFIPYKYLYSSINNRVKLFEGITQSMGEFTEFGWKGELEGESFINSFEFLCESLGYLVTSEKIDENKQFVSVYYYSNRSIVNIEKTDEYSEMTCIKVSGESELFLTEHCIPTHNTTVLTHLIAKRIISGEIRDTSKLLCTTFSKGGADEMGQRLEALLHQLGVRGNASIKTLHSMYYGLLKDLGYNISIVDGGTKMRYIRESCKENEVTLEEEELKSLDSFFGFQINNLLSDEELFKSYIYTLREQIPLDKYSKIRITFNNKKQMDNCMDFDDMQLLVYMLLKSEKYGADLQRYCKSKWEYIYVDEAQDVSKIQFEILKMIISDPDKIVFIGDDDQCVYEWRGADPSIILNICGLYTNLSMMKLTTNYRCCGEVVDKAAVGIKFNNIRSDKTMQPYRYGGDIHICNTGKCDMFEMSKYAFKYIKELVIDKGVNPNDIAVLSRNNFHLTILNNMLFKAGIYTKCADEMKFTKNPVYRLTNGLIQLGSNSISGNVTRDNLWKCCRYMNRQVSREIGSIQSSYGLSIKDTLGFLITNSPKSHISWVNPGFKPQPIDCCKCESIINRLNNEAFEDLQVVYELLNAGDQTQAIVGLLMLFRESKVDYFFKAEESFRFAAGFIEYLIYLFNDFGATNAIRYLSNIEQYEDGKLAVMAPLVTFSTIHGAKGKEWKNVIIFADDNVAFPSFQGIMNCINDGVPISDITNMIDEGRRLHYVAMTRAKEHLMIFGDKSNFGMYALESLEVMNFGTENNSNIISMAQHGMYDELVEKTKLGIFSDQSKYAYKIDISDLNTKVEKKYELSKLKGDA